MSDFFSMWVMVLVVVTLGITVFLFLWAPRVDIPTQADGTSGHVWAHGVLKESVRRLPTWWIVLSSIVLVSGISYLALYPGFGASKGSLGWTSQDELARDQTANRQLAVPLRDRARGKSVEQIATDPEALRVGQVLFIDNCAACHGREGRGNRALGAPDLTDNDWLYGGDGKSIVASIQDGRRGAMPPFAGTLSEEDITNVANYVQSLSGLPSDSLRTQLGKRLFSNCMPCHGADAKGNTAMGAPNLTDGTWLYGGNLSTVAETIRHGRNGFMPAWRGRLSEDDASLVAAWVYAQSHRAGTAAK
jgi:cytochrome c oxidase cbb3-type subunit 3